jgi:lysozyme
MSTNAQEFYRSKRDALIKDFEKFRAKPYLDSKGIPTIGYGTTFYPDGRAVTMNDQPITEDVADTYFQHHVNEFSDHISQSPGFSDLDHGTQAALTSFAYNTGPNVFTASKGYETLQSAVRSGNKEQIADAMRLYNNGGNAGLNRRREAEINLMNTKYQSPNPYNSSNMSPNPYN